MTNMGHRVGLHFDTTVYPSEQPPADYRREVSRELGLLAAIVDNPIEIVSFHNPHPDLVNRERIPGSPSHTYEPRFFSDLTYAADSGGRWRFGTPFERPGFKNGTAVHLLTHPIWWDHETPTGGPADTLERFAKNYRQRLDESLVRGFKAYREHMESMRQ